MVLGAPLGDKSSSIRRVGRGHRSWLDSDTPRLLASPGGLVAGRKRLLAPLRRQLCWERPQRQCIQARGGIVIPRVRTGGVGGDSSGSGDRRAQHPEWAPVRAQARGGARPVQAVGGPKDRGVGPTSPRGKDMSPEAYSGRGDEAQQLVANHMREWWDQQDAGVWERQTPPPLQQQQQHQGVAGFGRAAGVLRVLPQVAIACSAAYLFGYNLSVVNGPMESIAADLAFQGNAVAKGSVVSAFLIGAFLGCTVSGSLADGVGRRRAFQATALPVLLGSCLSALSGSLPTLIAGRLLVGIGLGIGSPLPTLYISEIAPASVRGMFNSLPPVAACLGILLALFVGAQFPLAPHGWRLCFWFGALPAAALVLLAEYMTESPRWLAQRGMWGAAQRAVESLQGPSGARQALADLKGASREGSTAAGEEQGSAWSALFARPHRKVVLVGTSLFALQQLSGINAVFYFSSAIFAQAGIQSEFVANLAVGIANLAAAGVSTVLMDRAGRKVLLSTSFLLMGLAMGAQAVTGLLCFISPSLSWVTGPVALGSTLLFVMAYSLGVGPVPGLLLPEILPTHIRAAGMALALSTFWVCNCLIGFAFLPLLEIVGSAGLSAFFSTTCLFAALFTQHFIIETKGKSLEEIEQAMLSD